MRERRAPTLLVRQLVTVPCGFSQSTSTPPPADFSSPLTSTLAASAASPRPDPRWTHSQHLLLRYLLAPHFPSTLSGRSSPRLWCATFLRRTASTTFFQPITLCSLSPIIPDCVRLVPNPPISHSLAAACRAAFCFFDTLRPAINPSGLSASTIHTQKILIRNDNPCRFQISFIDLSRTFRLSKRTRTTQINKRGGKPHDGTRTSAHASSEARLRVGICRTRASNEYQSWSDQPERNLSPCPSHIYHQCLGLQRAKHLSILGVVTRVIVRRVGEHGLPRHVFASNDPRDDSCRITSRT